VRLWDIGSRSARATLRGHYGGVSSVAISPDDKTIASAGRDGTIKLWDLESGEEKTTLTGHAAWVTSVAFSPDGRTLISGSEDGTVRLWQGASDTPAIDAQPAAREIEDCGADRHHG
jgi:WD40 repeat protein